MKYLTLIRSIALLHQHQRPHKTVQHHGARSSTSKLRWLTSTLPTGLRMRFWPFAGRVAAADQALAVGVTRWLQPSASGRRWRDPITASRAATCARRQAGRYAVENPSASVGGDGVLLAHRGGRGQSFVYELVFARLADSGKPTLPGLIEIEKLGSTS